MRVMRKRPPRARPRAADAVANAPRVRADALAGLENYGIRVDDERNAVRSKEPRLISADDSDIDVLVVPTNEELAIAQQSAAVVADRVAASGPAG